MKGTTDMTPAEELEATVAALRAMLARAEDDAAWWMDQAVDLGWTTPPVA